MNKIIFPLKLRDQNPDVANLQNAIQLFLDRSIILRDDERAREELSTILKRENNKQTYGKTTRDLVKIFQEERSLEISGTVDEDTASLINTILRRMGLLEPQDKETSLATLDAKYTVICHVIDSQKKPISGLHIQAFNQDPKSPDDPLGEIVTTNTDGMANIHFRQSDFTRHPGKEGPDINFEIYRENTRLEYTLPEDENDNGILKGFKPRRDPITIQIEKHQVVEGHIILENELPAEGLELLIYNRGFGGKDILLGDKIKTNDQGYYSFVYNPAGAMFNLDVRIKDPKDPQKEIPLAKTKFNVNADEVLNLVAPAVPLEAEYQRLAVDLKPQVGEMENLVGVQENVERQDLTLLNRATGWDARLIALASNAAKLEAEPDVDLSQEVLYGLFRVGLPSDKHQLAQVSVEAVNHALEKGLEAGIIDLDGSQVKEVKSQFETFSLKTRLAVPAPGSRSTYKDLLNSVRLQDDKPDTNEKDENTRMKFASVYLKHRGDAAQLWEKAAEDGIAHDDIQTLKWQGKLAFLTNNSEAMTTQLQQGRKISDPVELVEQGFYQPDNWKAEVRELADDDELDTLIPTAYEAGNVEDRLNAYAEDMARKVRLSYPTQVVGHMVEQDTTDEFKLGTARLATTALLKSASTRGFRLGQTPVEAFVRDNPEVLDGIDANTVETAKQSMKTLQRVYQLTPSNEAMPTLLSLGLTSAYDIVALSQEDFLTSYGPKFPSPEQARLVYRKAQQVSSVTYNLFTIAKKLDSEAPVYGMSAPAEVRESVKNELIKQFPTLESLFGSMDFCECEHCRSVLSPAAYMVDLLQFVDAEPQMWDNFLADWKDKHNGQDYTARYKKPYDALIERRPDLPHIPLTCENTNIALPYIDVVNEILEYYVANEKLDDKAAHDTGEATTEELLAEPQNVVAEAYDKLQKARYPLNLPFDLWIDTVRKFCDYFETPLWQLLEAFRKGDELFVPTQSYDREAIFIESLGLSPAEYAIFTDPDPLDKWHELYGYTTDVEAMTVATNADTSQRIDLNSAKALSRRLGVTYKELVEIIQTGFVNPNLAEMTLLYKLGVAIQDVLFYRDHKELLTEDEDLNTLPSEDQKRLEEVKAFEERLDELSATFQPSGFDAKVWLNNALDNNTFDDILVLADTDASCNFDQTTLLYSFRQIEGQRAADAIAFLKINLFVRLWRKLGWTIEETDCALRAFVPKNTPFDAAHLSQSPLKTALIYLAHLNKLDEQLRVGKQSRLKLITLWSDLTTTGKKPLYAQLFLTQSMLKSTEVFDDVAKRYMSVFDDPLGQYLSNAGLAAMAEQVKHKVSMENVKLADKIDPDAFPDSTNVSIDYDELGEVQSLVYRGVLTDEDKEQLKTLSPSPALEPLLEAVQTKAEEFMFIKGHLLAIQGGLGLTADDIDRILTDAGLAIENAEMSLANVSLLYRYSLLAKALRLSVLELISLKHLSKLDPFKSLLPGPLAALEDDHPFTQTLQFVEIAGYVKESGLKIEDLDYLLRHHIEDPVGKYRPNKEATLVLMKMLAEGIRAIRAEHAVPEDAGAMDEEVLRQKLGLVLPADVVESFLAMMNGTVEFTATRTGVQPGNQLIPEGFADEPSIRQISYNTTLQEQKLTFRGVLFDAEKKDLKSQLPKPVSPNPHVPSPIFDYLLDDVQEQACSFFVKNLQKQAPDIQPEAGFLDLADFKLLFAPTPADLDEEEKQERVRQQRTRLAQTFLPFLQQRLIRQFIVQTLTDQTDADPMLVESLLTDTRLLNETKSGGASQSLLAALNATGEYGITATFFASPDLSGATLATSTFADASLKDKDGNPLKPTGANSARFEGYLEVPGPGAYRFYVALELNAEAELRFDHLPDPLFLSGTAANNVAEISEYLELKPGVPYRFSLTLKKLNNGEARLMVQGETLPKDSLTQLTLYPLTAIERGEHALTLLNKALQLIQNLNLNEREVRYLLTHADDFDNLNLSKLPTQESEDSPAGARVLFAQFLRLAGYARIKRDLAGGMDDLISVFEANEVNDMDKVYQLITQLTRRDEATVKATANALSTTPAFADELALQRLWEALQVIKRFGVSVNSIVGWTRIVNATATAEERFSIARDLKEAIKARFEPETWQHVAQPIFDKLRQRQRDALVAHVMHQHDFARIEQLYEYFLIDPGMEPVVQTSRIRLAIASVQLFIQRCLLNLEKHVHPSVIKTKQWEWMKRYRVWEANRKIFLFPENWLEPEFRDDKTHLFSELEGSLLQGDVSSDLVEDAFLNYLKKLDELARLDIVAMHLEDKADPTQNTLHVIGRTYSQPHKYFYRRYAHQVWTPWEPVTAEIEGDHLAPVVWRNRLYLFWVTFMDKADQNPNEEPQTKNPSNNVLRKLVNQNSTMEHLTENVLDTSITNSVRPTGKKLVDVTLSEIMTNLNNLASKKEVVVQLHWSENLQGEWSTRESGSFSASLSKTVNSDFYPRSAFIHVSKEQYENGEERGVYIHLGGAISRAFYLAGRNSIPEPVNNESKPAMPYSNSEVRANRYSGGRALTVEFKRRIITEDEKPPVDKVETPSILQQGSGYTLLPCNNNITLGALDVTSLDTSNPMEAAKAIETGLHEIALLMKPIFYQDNAHTLFIEPNVVERTSEEWQEWVTRTPQPDQEWDHSNWWAKNVVVAAIPRNKLPIGPRAPTWHSPESLINVMTEQDWLINPVTALLFEGDLIAPRGRAQVAVLPPAEAAGAIALGGQSVNVHTGSGLAPGRTVVAVASDALDQAGLIQEAGGLNVVGSGGFNSALAQNFNRINRSGLGPVNLGSRSIRR